MFVCGVEMSEGLDGWWSRRSFGRVGNCAYLRAWNVIL